MGDFPKFGHNCADLPGHLASISPLSTVPPGISSTSSRPDIVLVSDDHVILLELSVVTNSDDHFKAASSRKEARYGSLISDLWFNCFISDH